MCLTCPLPPPSARVHADPPAPSPRLQGDLAEAAVRKDMGSAKELLGRKRHQDHLLGDLGQVIPLGTLISLSIGSRQSFLGDRGWRPQ